MGSSRCGIFEEAMLLTHSEDILVSSQPFISLRLLDLLWRPAFQRSIEENSAGKVILYRTKTWKT